MTSSFPAHDESILTNAYANIKLIADDTWANDKGNLYRRLNEFLWVQHCKLCEKKYQGNGSHHCPKRRVRDVIPKSRLARYGNYEYDEERERWYTSQEGAEDIFREQSFREDQKQKEFWMLPEIDEYLARLNSASDYVPFSDKDRHVTKRQESWKKLSETQTEKIESCMKPWCSGGRRNVDVSYARRAENRYKIETFEEMELQARIESGKVRDLWNPLKFQEICDYSQSLRNEYFHHQQFYPQCRNFHYQPLVLKSDYRQATRAAAVATSQQQLISSIPQPLLSPEVPEFFPKAPCFQYLPSTYERSYQDELFPYNRSGCVANAGLMFQNASFSMLPSANSSMYLQFQNHHWVPARVQRPAVSSIPAATYFCTNSGPRQHATSAPIPVYQRPMEFYQQESSNATFQKRGKSQGVDFNNLILLTKSAMKMRKTASTAKDSRSKDADEDPDSDSISRKRLYRDVVVNSSCLDVFDRKYEELERQAVEQYKNSEESLALRYQELERQAVEQYRNYGASDSSSKDRVTENEDRACSDDQNGCLGNGQCDKEKRTVISKSLTALSEHISEYHSKNITKGASGDKIEKTVHTSSTRHLILVSPLKHESGAVTLTNASVDFEDLYSFPSVDKKNLPICYREREVVDQCGAGGDKITILHRRET